MSETESNRSQTVFPFAAVVGQDLMRLSLLLNAVNPSIGGVLIRGERGTAKSTAVRGLAAVLPEIDEERWTRLLKIITVRSSTFPVTIQAANIRNERKFGLFARVFLRETDAQIVSWKEI